MADGIERLEQLDRLTASPLAEQRVADLLCELNNVGAQRADRILEDAELPPDVTVIDLGPGDCSPRLTRGTSSAGRSTLRPPRSTSAGTCGRSAIACISCGCTGARRKPSACRPFEREEMIDRVLAAAGEINGACELEQVDPLRRRRQSTPRSTCESAVRNIAGAVLYAPVDDDHFDVLLTRLSDLVTC